MQGHISATIIPTATPTAKASAANTLIAYSHSAFRESLSLNDSDPCRVRRHAI